MGSEHRFLTTIRQLGVARGLSRDMTIKRLDHVSVVVDDLAARVMSHARTVDYYAAER